MIVHENLVKICVSPVSVNIFLFVLVSCLIFINVVIIIIFNLHHHVVVVSPIAWSIWGPESLCCMCWPERPVVEQRSRGRFGMRRCC